MEEKLRKYVEGLFSSAPKTKTAVELREEIYTNLVEKYHDVVKTGATEEEAYDIVKKSVGNVDELIDSLYERSEEDKMQMEINKKKKAVYDAVSAMLYIASPIAIIALAVVGQPIPGVIILLACIAVATGLKIYANSVYGAYEKMDDTVVEEFKEWKAEKDVSGQRKNIYSGTIWLIIVILYFVISFTTGAWYVSWIIFLIGAAVNQLISIHLNK